MIVQIGFYALSLVAYLMVIAVLKYAEQSKRLIRNYAVLGVVWLVYLVAISQMGMLDSFSLPPRVPLLIVIPAVAIIVVLTGRPALKRALESVPLHLPVFLTAFRILVELLIYGAYRNGVFPQQVTFEGLNFDVLVGLSSVVVGSLLLRNKFTMKALWVWNIASLMVLSITVYSFVSTYYFSDYVVSAGTIAFVRFPYLLLASVLLPIAIFLHVFSMRQLLVLKASRI